MTETKELQKNRSKWWQDADGHWRSDVYLVSKNMTLAEASLERGDTNDVDGDYAIQRSVRTDIPKARDEVTITSLKRPGTGDTNLVPEWTKKWQDARGLWRRDLYYCDPTKSLADVSLERGDVCSEDATMYIQEAHLDDEAAGDIRNKITTLSFKKRLRA
jgi:hypothetical protein